MSNRSTDRFIDRVVVIAGGASGIGAETARRFAAEGARVVVADRNLAGAQQVADEIGGRAFEVDLVHPAPLAEFVEAEFGRLDVLVNSVYAISSGDFLQARPEHLRRDLEVTLLAPMLAAQALLPLMISSGGGVVLSLASVNGMGWYGGQGYSVAKAGLVHFTRTLAAEFADRGVRVCAVAPGTIETPAWSEAKAANPETMTEIGQRYPLGRVGQPGDVAEALLFLASDESSWTTGVTLPVEGGILLTNAFPQDRD